MDDELSQATQARTERQGDRDLIYEMLGSHLRHLTSNLMRVVRGAGRPSDIMSQMASVFEWLKRYEEDCGVPMLVGDLPGLFHVPENLRQRDSDVEGLRTKALDDIVNGALQVAASRLVGQSGFERQGEQDILRGIGAYQEAKRQGIADCRSS